MALDNRPSVRLVLSSASSAEPAEPADPRAPPDPVRARRAGPAAADAPPDAPAPARPAEHAPTRPAAAPDPNAERDRLIVEHYAMVRAVARKTAQRLPSHVDVDELVSIGVLGLIDAVSRFDASRGVPFRAYAEIRVRGAILDGVRGDDWAPRAVRRAGTKLENARAELRRRLRREPTRDEIAVALDLSAPEYERLLASSEVRRLVSIDRPAGEEGEARIGDVVAADDASPLDTWLEAETVGGLAEAVGDLPPRERAVVVAYYEEGLSLKQIGVRFGVTESRVCQIHGQALKRLRGLVANADAAATRPAPIGADQREYPRVKIDVGVRYRALSDDTELGRWLSGAPMELLRLAGATVNFSVTGAAFRAADTLVVGDRLLLELTLPDDPPRVRCGARVVRVGAPDGGGRAEIAVAFDHIAGEDNARLAEHVLRVQRALD